MTHLHCSAAPATGTLRRHPDNPRYFADTTGKPVYLTGSHVWNNLQDMEPGEEPARFDWDTYLDFLQRLNHNFVRLWHWDLTILAAPQYGRAQPLIVTPHPWPRLGPGRALDAGPRFDLQRFDEAYFQRLRDRAKQARERGVYVSIMLFEGWGLQFVPDGWRSHPFHPGNNVNGIDGGGVAVHELRSPDVTAVQEAYVRRVIDTVNDLDNVLFEISNENHPASTPWQYHMIRFIHEYEAAKPKQHPVGMTFQYKGGSNAALFDGPADWVSPNPDGGYKDAPPAADGRKVVLADTDHLWGIGGNQQWVWKSFLRGHNPLFMDPYDGAVLGKRFDPRWDPIRRSLGHTLRYAGRIDLAKAVPRGYLASTGYCLADPGKEYLIYLPEGGRVTVDLSAVVGPLTVEWFDPNADKTEGGEQVSGGGERTFSSPSSSDAVLYLTTSGR